MDDYRIVHRDKVAGPEVRKYYLNVDTRFKISPIAPDSNCSINMVDPIRNITKIRVASVELPNIPYIISEYRGNNVFEIKDSSGNSLKRVTIGDGNYTISEIINEINLQSSTYFIVSYDSVTRKIVLTSTPAGIGKYIYFDPDKRFTARDMDWGLGYNLGFRKRVYIIPNGSFISEAFVNLNGFQYYLLNLNGYDIIRSSLKDNTLIGAAKLIVNNQVTKGEAVDMLFEDGRNLMTFEFEPSPPIDLTRIDLRITDPYGNDVYPYQEPISLTLEIMTISQSQLFEQQRNRMFENKRIL